MASETYEFLLALAKGEEYSRWNYPDKLIYDVKPSDSGTGTKIVITFDNDDDFLDVIGIEEESEDRWAWHKYMSSYSDFDSYYYDDEWREGYIIRNFNQENINRVNEILKYVNPTIVLNTDNEESTQTVSKYLASRFESYTSDISYEFGTLDQDCKSRAAQQEIKKETSNLFSRFGIIEISHAYKYETTVGILLSLYKMMKAEDDDLKELLKKIDEKYNSHLSRGEDWYELEYSVYCDDFDNETFQNEVERTLEKMMEEVEEELFEGVDSDEYNKMYEKVLSLGGFDKYIDLPEKGIQVIFHDFNPKTNKLYFVLYKGNKKEERSVDNLEDLNLELYHPELFESIRKILKKLL